jgi:peptidoglycan hydrolase-like protein with peptidoglycan-binding domain
MSWAMGEGFADGTKWPNFRTKCAAEEWLEAAKNCNMANAWLIKRNAVNRGLFRNAAYSAAPPPDDPSKLFLEIPGSRPVIQIGDQDIPGSTEHVATAQGFLNWLGYSVAKTGTFDQATEGAVKAFQTDERGLPNGGAFSIDGKIGPLTWAGLGYVVP